MALHHRYLNGLFGYEFEDTLFSQNRTRDFGADYFAFSSAIQNYYAASFDLQGRVDFGGLGSSFSEQYSSGGGFSGPGPDAAPDGPLFGPIIPNFDLSSLDGTNGTAFNGVTADDQSGISVSGIGDFNGDGVDDFIIGARSADPNGLFSGASYIVFGVAGGFGTASFDLGQLNGTNGFVLNGITSNHLSGTSVSAAGDVNGDGFNDVLIGAPQAGSGDVYLVYGSAAPFSSTFELSTLNGTNGTRFNGVALADFAGNSVSNAGDFNGDGIADMIIGADFADPNGGSSGATYIVFGNAGGFGATFNLSTLNGTNGFVLNGVFGGDHSGNSVSSAGDVNNDGIDDIIIGADDADVNGVNLVGQAYVVFGSLLPFAASFELSSLLAVNGGNGSLGFAITGGQINDHIARHVANAGDVNGDGIDDVIVSAPLGGSNGEAYVIFGAAGFAPEINVSALDGTNGFAIQGFAAIGGVGSVARAGDVNGDGVGDLIVGAPANASDPGHAYVVFGRDSTNPFGAVLALTAMNSNDGFVINGINANDQTGSSVSAAGDVNGDGFGDLLVGAWQADSGSLIDVGRSYIIYGQDPGITSRRANSAR